MHSTTVNMLFMTNKIKRVFVTYAVTATGPVEAVNPEPLGPATDSAR